MYVAAVNDIIGRADIGFLGVGDAIVSIGWGGPPAGRALLGAYETGFGDLIKLAPSGHWKVVADISLSRMPRIRLAGQWTPTPTGS